jgi:endogenous inhibitor of DNA gyrase (YacG/DUF329 family)
MECPRCTHRAVITIELPMNGQAVTFLRCTHCDLQSWRDEATAISLDQVLDLARVQR